VVTGDPSGLGSQTVALLGQLHFAREQEEEADAGARQLLEKARVDPKAMARIFKRMQGEEAAPPVYLSTHPRMAERIAEAEKWAETARYRFEPMGIELPVGGCAAGR
jgi:predicted Zn-dependent protease